MKLTNYSIINDCVDFEFEINETIIYVSLYRDEIKIDSGDEFIPFNIMLEIIEIIKKGETLIKWK